MELSEAVCAVDIRWFLMVGAVTFGTPVSD